MIYFVLLLLVYFFNLFPAPGFYSILWSFKVALKIQSFANQSYSELLFGYVFSSHTIPRFSLSIAIFSFTFDKLLCWFDLVPSLPTLHFGLTNPDLVVYIIFYLFGILHDFILMVNLSVNSHILKTVLTDLFLKACNPVLPDSGSTSLRCHFASFWIDIFLSY